MDISCASALSKCKMRSELVSDLSGKPASPEAIGSKQFSRGAHLSEGGYPAIATRGLILKKKKRHSILQSKGNHQGNEKATY